MLERHGRPEAEREAPCESADVSRWTPPPDHPGETSCAPLPVHRAGDPRRGADPRIRLGQDLDDDPAVLRAPFLRLVRRDWLLFAVADDADLVQRHLVLVV